MFQKENLKIESDLSEFICGLLGPTGSFSAEALNFYFPGARQVFYKNIPQVFSALDDGLVPYIFVPLRNNNGGLVAETQTALQQSLAGPFSWEANLYETVGEYRYEVRQILWGLKGGKLPEIESVFSHPQALKQCSKFLAKLLPSATLHSTSSTSQAIDEILLGANPRQAAIAGPQVARFASEKLSPLVEDISNIIPNYTVFSLISRPNR